MVSEHFFGGSVHRTFLSHGSSITLLPVRSASAERGTRPPCRQEASTANLFAVGNSFDSTRLRFQQALDNIPYRRLKSFHWCEILYWNKLLGTQPYSKSYTGNSQNREAKPLTERSCFQPVPAQSYGSNGGNAGRKQSFSSLLSFSSIICTWTSLCLLISLDFCFCLPFYPSLLLGHLLCICPYACCNWSLFPGIGCDSDACLSSHSLSSPCSALLRASDQNPVKGIGCIRCYRQKRKTVKAWGELGRVEHGSSAA